MDDPVDLALQLYALVVGLDIGLGWVQPDSMRWPRRLTHMLTEPPQAAVRGLLRVVPLGGWDLSPLVVLGLLAAVRVWWNLP